MFLLKVPRAWVLCAGGDLPGERVKPGLWAAPGLPGR